MLLRLTSLFFFLLNYWHIRNCKNSNVTLITNGFLNIYIISFNNINRFFLVILYAIGYKKLTLAELLRALFRFGKAIRAASFCVGRNRDQVAWLS